MLLRQRPRSILETSRFEEYATPFRLRLRGRVPGANLLLLMLRGPVVLERAENTRWTSAKLGKLETLLGRVGVDPLIADDVQAHVRMPSALRAFRGRLLGDRGDRGTNAQCRSLMGRHRGFVDDCSVRRLFSDPGAPVRKDIAVAIRSGSHLLKRPKVLLGSDEDAAHHGLLGTRGSLFTTFGAMGSRVRSRREGSALVLLRATVVDEIRREVLHFALAVEQQHHAPVRRPIRVIGESVVFAIRRLRQGTLLRSFSLLRRSTIR